MTFAASKSPHSPILPTSVAVLDRGVADLVAAKDRFSKLSIADRINMIDRVLADLRTVEVRWVEASCAAKGIATDAPAAGEEWLAGPMVTYRNLRLLRQSLMDVRDYGRPQLPEKAVSKNAAGQTVAKVFPLDMYDRVLMTGFTAEVWMEPGVEPAGLAETMATIYHQDPVGKVALVLGAGNVSSIGPLDVVYRLFVENEVCILKMNPVNEYLGPLIEEAFKVLIDNDFVRVVYGGAEVGGHLCTHHGVDTIHITGSDRTHDAIVWGTGAEQAERKAAGTPLNTKPITSELGCVTPLIIVPGQWSAADLAFQAANVATMVANNGSFNCNAAKLLVLHDGWSQRKQFLAAVEDALKSAPARRAYYPGAFDRYKQFTDAHPDAKKVGASTDDSVVPWTIISEIPYDSDDMAFSTEAFCGVLCDTAVPGTDGADFLKNAVEFVNDKVWGTLSASVIIHPKTQKLAVMAQALEQALADMRYGTIVVNHWAGLGYGLGVTTWGAYPGHTLDDIQSGRGVVHNTFLFSKPQKTIIRGPFKVAPKPPWFVTNKRTHITGRLLAEFEAAPSFLKVPGIAINAALG